ncbi:hypothetical protein [Streptomyces sp. NBC_01594]|uniref:hypothetical protein n=1 Tax=Streptomyces sp. NBC_01594 TaxID=2975890 RepID=UPI00386CDC0B
MATVSFVDETTSGTRQDAWELAMAEERLPLREVIRRRVFQEVYNAWQPELFQSVCGARVAIYGGRGETTLVGLGQVRIGVGMSRWQVGQAPVQRARSICSSRTTW